MSNENNTWPLLKVHLQALPGNTIPEPSVSYLNRELKVQSLQTSSPPIAMHCSFEEAMEQLSRLERLFTELDGSFVWRGQGQHGSWQIDGMLYDRLGAVQWCEIKGTCPLHHWQALLGCFGWPQQALLVHLLDRQCFALVEDIEVLWH